jgi:hypothetical protein
MCYKIASLVFVFFALSCNENSDSKFKNTDTTTVTGTVRDENNNFEKYWANFTQILLNKRADDFRLNSLSRVEVRDRFVSLDTLLMSYESFFDEELLKSISDKDKVQIIDSEVESDSLLTAQLPESTVFKTKDVNITKSDRSPNQVVVILKFVKTLKGYKFYGYDSIGEKVRN